MKVSNIKIPPVFLGYAIGAVILIVIIYFALRRVGLIRSAKEKREERENEQAIIELSTSDIFGPQLWRAYPVNERLSEQQAKHYAKLIEDAFGIWGWGDDESRIYGVFRDLNYKHNVSQIAWEYAREFGRDLFGDLQGALDESEMLQIKRIIETLG